MAEVLVQNMRNPEQAITVMVTLKRLIVKDQGPDVKWVLEASTDELDAEGELIPSSIKYLSNQDTLTEDINELIEELCSKVDWEYLPDTTPPEVVSHWPLSGATGVSVETDILINLTEEVPSAGIDLNSIKVRVKGYDITDQITVTGDIHACSIQFTPGTKYKPATDDYGWESIPVEDPDD